MSDALLTRIAAALETIAKNGGVAPAAAGASTNRAAAGASAGKATPAAGSNKGAGAGTGNKAAPVGANKGGTPAAAKAPGGKHNSEQVRDIIRKVATNPSLGKQAALDVLDQDGGGVTNVTNLKPEFFDNVYEACQALLSSDGAADSSAAAEDEFDPTA